jgi:site-specific DNA-methyltransferase (adenine-specific)
MTEGDDVHLLRGDCLTSLNEVVRGAVDLVLADLPYGTTRSPWDRPIDLAKLWPELQLVGKPNCAYVMFGSGGFTPTLIESNRDQWKYNWYWQKEKGTGFLNSKRMPLRSVEEIAVFYSKQPTYNPQMVPRVRPLKGHLAATASTVWGKVGSVKAPKSVIYESSHPTTLLRFPRDKGNRGVHGAQKPVDLLRFLIRTYTEPGDLVVDPVMGSGSTGLACRLENRRFIGIELDPAIYALAHKRILQ